MKKYLSRCLKLIWRFLKYALLAAGLVLIIILILLSRAYNDFREALAAGQEGKTEITLAIEAAQKQNWTETSSKAQNANARFNSALAALNRTRNNPAIKNVSLVRTQVDDLEYLLKTAEILSRSVTRVTPILQNLDEIRSGSASRNFVDLAPNDKIRFLQLIYESEPELNGLKANLNLAILNLDKIHRIGVLWPVYKQIADIKQELNQAVVLMTKALPLVKLLPALAGYPDTSRFLLILQNNDELRPTGGFIGVYGILENRNGEIVSIKTDDSYHLDMPASTSGWNMEPPAVLKKYLEVEKWYFRDANWSPDWPTAAKQIENIYNGENIATQQPVVPFTGLVAITPDLIADLIGLVGPITVNDATYTADNFQPLLQYNVEVAYKDQAIASWDRKEIINELVTKLKERLFNLPSELWGDFFQIINNRINTKSIQIYFPNTAWEDWTRVLGASGELKDVSGDYLMIVDSNLGAFKSDAVVKKSLTYTLTLNNNQPDASVKLDYRHEGDFDWRTTRYRSYTRIYAPWGSKFISLSGLGDGTTADLSVTDDKDLKKTVFGFFLTVEPGTDREIILNYRLPETIREQLNAGTYQLLVQKQAGQRVENFKAIINQPKKKTVTWQTKLETDQTFVINQ
ncbi:MAG: DUF4012 domain-containing protein [Patescibacteria group bacterium]